MMNEATLATLSAGLPRRFAGRLPTPDLGGLESMARSGPPVRNVSPAPNEHEQAASEACRDDLVELQGAYDDQAGVAGIDPGASVLPDRRFITGSDHSAVPQHAISAHW